MAVKNSVQLLNEFIAENRDRTAADAPFHIALGNEAADLDSMVSSILYSYFQRLTSTDTRMRYAPVINIPGNDFKLRTEAVYLMKETGVDTASLPFIDTVDLALFHEKNLLRLTLVDHNTLSARQAGLAGSVAGIIDHHDDGGLFLQAEKRIVEPVGSCATLVAEEILSRRPDMLDAGTAKLLLGTILLDTVNLDPTAKRATERDAAAVSRLAAVVKEDTGKLFEKLQAEKFNVASLDSNDLLRKDYKQWKMGNAAVGVSSVLMPVAAWLKKDARLETAFREYTRKHGLDLLIAMNASTHPVFHREMIVYTGDRDLMDRLPVFLNTHGLGLTRHSLTPPVKSDSLAVYDQDNEAYSRKKLQPLLERFFNGGER